MKKENIGRLVAALVIPIVIGGISAALSAKGMINYATMNKPPLSPPAWMFPVAWTILYLMMGFASYLIVVSEGEMRSKAMALIIYALQLLMNFMWSIIFFKWEQFMTAFAWLVVMFVFVIGCTIRFWRIKKLAAYMMIPYIAWLMFAAYLNMGAYILNQA
ncbi:MAG: tryptophan-rich sensory protein [Lachnospiraceae bacterium]|nr:tryptophan-rich sensory protein [Lachnospiraceae bacterium]